MPERLLFRQAALKTDTVTAVNNNTAAANNSGTTTTAVNSANTAAAPAGDSRFATPKSAFETFAKAIQEKDNATVEKALAPDVLEMMKKLVPEKKTLAEFLAASTDPEALKIPADYSEKIEGSTATLNTTGKGGKPDPTYMTKSGNDWKVDLSPEGKKALKDMADKMDKLEKDVENLKKEVNANAAEEKKDKSAAKSSGAITDQ